MKLFFAGYGVTPEAAKKAGIKNKLYSYANDKSSIKKWGSKNLMIDSGAFSVFTGKAKIDLQDHTQYILDTKPDYAIQLDVIGEEQETWENYVYQKQYLPEIMPVIHYKASDKHIKRVIEEASYILLGGLVPLATNKKKMIAWVDYLYSNYKMQTKKIHLLGVTSTKILERYPIYSCDSTAWFSTYAFGRSQRYDNNAHISALSKNNSARQIKLEVQHYLELEDYITKLWESRGIKWD